MKKFVIYLPLFAVVPMLSGCAGKDVPAKNPPAVQLDKFSADDEISALETARKFAAAFEKALVSGDFKYLEPTVAGKKLSASNFSGMRNAMIKLYGTPKKLTYATTLRQGKLRDMLWKITFEKQKAPEASCEYNEILLCVRIFREPGKTPEVAGFFIKRF